MVSSATVPLMALRQQLASLEDPILRAISYRKDVPLNPGLYLKNKLFLGLSLFDVKLYGREMQRALAGDYVHGERPLSKLWLPKVKRSLPDVTQCIKQRYFEFLCEVCPEGDNPHTYDDAFVRDLDALWFLSDRIHEAGTAVARTKLENSDADTVAKYQAAIAAKDVDELIALLSDKGQEKAVVERVREKATQSRLPPHTAEDLFQKLVFPLTLKAEALDLIVINSAAA